jgi:hypothetical protein
MSVAPHNWMTGGPVDHLNPLVDLGTPMMTVREREIVRARMLFFGYKLASERFWAPRLGFGGTANMTTMIYAQLAFVSFLYPNHPLAHEWRKAALDEINQELDNWAGPSGGWLEAPHYATVSLDHIAAVGFAMQNMKLEGPLHHQGLKNAVDWLAKISSPPDPRFGNRRCFAPLGNTYIFETSGLFGYMAKVWRERDPKYANAMRWIWKEHGYPMHPGIGGAYPTSDGLREIMVDTTPLAGPPDWGSEHFAGSGAIMRSGFPTDRETQLYLIQGRLHEHYDRDEGSFHLWGKGRPLSLDWGYHGCDEAAHHNRVDLGGAGRIEPFVTQPAADYLHNIQTHWDRQMVFVKDADPLGPNYFVVLDSVAANAPRAGAWWLWLCTPEEPSLDGATVRMKGSDDVDMDVWFAPSAAPLLAAQKGGARGIKTEELTLTIHSGGPKPPTQRGLTLSIGASASLLWAMYPRLNTKRPPTIAALAGDKGVKVESVAGTDYVFLALEPFEFKEGGISFKGKAGVIQVRGKKVDLTLFEAGEIAFDGASLVTKDRPASKSVTR